MKTTSVKWISRAMAEKQLGVTPAQFVNLRDSGRIKGHELPGFKRPAYKADEIAALRLALNAATGGAR